MKAHGGEIMRFMLGHARDVQLANEAFAVFSEDICRGIHGFAFRCSVRTWIYSVAHRALAKVWRAHARSKARTSELPASAELSLPASPARSETPVYVRTESKQRLLRLRESLDPGDQVLLELRLGERFSWKDIARIHLDDQSVGSKTLDAEAARLRKRFQVLKESLRAMARADGLLPPNDASR
ncbi:MAG TPA: hypothetical protein VK509_06110 [Polyangiales bacterium]|nr:hypothetical protein [Polyangiales bacterium]